MGACHSEYKKRNSFSGNKRVFNPSEKDYSISTQSYDKRRGKTPNIRINDINSNNKEIFKENEIFDINSNKNNISKLEIISKTDKISECSENFIINQKLNNLKKKELEKEIFFNKNVKDKNNNKLSIDYNAHTKFNNFGKKQEGAPIKIIQKFDVDKKDYNAQLEIEKLFYFENNNNNIRNTCIYVIDDEYDDDYQKIYSNNIEYYNNIKMNLINRIKLSNEILVLPERKWYNELIDLSELLTKTREKSDNRNFKIYLTKIIKVYEDFNWITDSISNFYINLKNNNLKFNKEKIGLPEYKSEKWIKGFKWKGLFIKICEGDKNKTIINEIKALNYFFFDYIQIIDKYQIIQEDQLSNMIIFPLISYSICNGKILIVSCLINVDNLEDEYNINILKKNEIIKLYSDIKNNNINNNSININNIDNNINNDLNIENKNLINTMGKKYYVDDLLISKLFFNLNDSNFIKIRNNKFIIFNLYNLIPNLFGIKFDVVKKINFYSKIKNKKIFYSLNYDTTNKINIHKEFSKYKNPKDIIENLYYMKYNSSIKRKDIIINNIIFRIFYEKEIQNLDDIKNNFPFSKNFVDNLFNYTFTKKNISMKTIIKEPYIIIYDLLEPLKLKYSLIKSNNKFVSNEHNINEENIYNDKISKNIYFYQSNYLSFFISWCKSLSQNSFNIKNYSDLKENMNKYGINSILRFFSLVIIDNPDISDIIKISILIKGIKYAFDKEINNHNINYNEEGIKYILIIYIKCILYPNEILPKEQSQFDIIFKEIVFYCNILFLKLKLIDYYLNLDLLSLTDIKDHKIDIKNSSNILNEEKIKLISKKLSGFNSPEDFLIHIISIARKKPFLFLSELEQKLHFIINPFIKFKSSLSIESMSKQLNMSHISINYNYKTFSYVKSKEISGLMLAKIINRYNSYDLNEINLYNKEEEKNKDNDNISYNSRYSRYSGFKRNIVPSLGDDSENNQYIFLVNNMNNSCKENITNNSDNSKEYTINNNKSIKLNKINKINNKDSISSSLNTTQKLATNCSEYNNNANVNKIEWDNIKNDFLMELPSICYKMHYITDESEQKINKYKNFSLYKNLSNFYNIINPKIIIEWNEILEEMFIKIYSCKGDAEHALLYSFFYLFIYYFFFVKKRDECKKILKKIYNLYHNGGYKLSLNDLLIINLFLSILNNNYIKQEENYSKCIMLILLLYGEPRGRYNDSHGILKFPLWNICRKTLKFEQITTNENFREMFHTLDYLDWKNSLFREKYNLFEKNEIINYADNAMYNLDDILLLYNIDKNNFKNKDNNCLDEFKLSQKIFDEKILELKIIKYFNFPKLSDFNDKENNIFDNKEFILYFMKQMQSLYIGDKIILEQNYVNNEISNEIFNPNKEENNTKNNFIKFNNSNAINLNLNKINLKNYNDNYRYSGIPRLSKKEYYNPIISNIKNNINNKFNISGKKSIQYKRPLSGTNNSKYIAKNKTGIIFSHFLYKELLEKLSYQKNMPSGVVFSFGNNRHNETSHDNIVNLTLPRIIFKLKNECLNKIYAGWEHNIILNKNGEIFSFGYNKNCQCGIPNNNGENDKINNPTNISIINNNIKAISASCGNEHTLILKNDNSVYAFGNNEEGELGLNDKTIKTHKLNKINFGKYSNQIAQISAGTVHNLALTKNGKVFAWGSSQGGQLGLPEEYLINQPGFKENYFIFEPTIVHFKKNIIKNNINNIKNNDDIEENEDFIIKISCGEAHSVALSNKGNVYSWGFGSNGQLGLGFCEDTFEPGLGTQLSRKFTPQYVKNLENEDIIDINCGKTFSMFISDKKEILACGVNDLNQLGINDNFQMRNNEILCYDIVWPTSLDYLIEKKVQKLSCGEGHCLAIINYPEKEKVVWSWGNNKFGQLGHGSWVNKSLPKPINYLHGFNNDKIQFEDVACGGFHSLCLVKYKEDLSWIENDFEKIINAINYKYDYMNINTNSNDID